MRNVIRLQGTWVDLSRVVSISQPIIDFKFGPIPGAVSYSMTVEMLNHPLQFEKEVLPSSLVKGMKISDDEQIQSLFESQFTDRKVCICSDRFLHSIVQKFGMNDMECVLRKLNHLSGFFTEYDALIELFSRNG